MESYKNPYRPGAGTKPLVISGREKEIQKADTLLKSVKYGAPQRSLMLYGLRGVGKTVLLNAMESIAANEGYLSEHLEMSETDEFRRVIAKSCRKMLLNLSQKENIKDKCIRALGILKAFSLTIPDGPELKIDVDAVVGIGDSGDLDSDLIDLFVALGETASDSEKYVCFFIDEVQYLSEEAVSALIASSHRITQKNLPVVFICAGLPQIAALSGDAKSYAERLFEFIPIGELRNGSDLEALIEPARTRDVSYTPEAQNIILAEAKGYPYFIQEFGKHAWELAEESPISEEVAVNASIAAICTLDDSFFKVRMDRSTSAEREFMMAMSSLGSGPYKSLEIAQKLDKKINSIGPVRAQLISKGFIYSPQHGEVAFSVPLYDEYIRRNFDISKYQ
ncbi:MAG: ATP-binding protein [Methylobacter sp.]|uniref:ATP-binding protein n=1 Tax=Methylobacter sp. TaxID=2051955 RepID=UPI002583D3A8|nr:ATP-binding protein [Methylobacter sp.]MCL7419645.1 ATP-binding protein [Methylobacter sp.]